MLSRPANTHLSARANFVILFNRFTWRITGSPQARSFPILVKQRQPVPHRGVCYLREKECPRDLSSPLAS